LRKLLNIPLENKIILYQGVILEGRGILKIARVLDRFPNSDFVIIGDGEFRQKFEEEISKLPQSERVHFIGSVNHNDLLNYTADADIGVVLIENISISYYYALPNKLFEYIMAGVPVLASDLPQMKKIVDEYNIGKYINPDNENELIEVLSEMISNNTLIETLKINCYKAAKELNWESEFRKVEKYLD
jgi:glycosyltransferase involved in cell wall biosynthesis